MALCRTSYTALQMSNRWIDRFIDRGPPPPPRVGANASRAVPGGRESVPPRPGTGGRWVCMLPAPRLKGCRYPIFGSGIAGGDTAALTGNSCSAPCGCPAANDGRSATGAAGAEFCVSEWAPPDPVRNSRKRALSWRVEWPNIFSTSALHSDWKLFMASAKESANDAQSDREQDKQRIKRLRVALREHSAALDRVRGAVDAQQLQAFLDRNDELSNQVDDVLAHGLLTDAYLKITLMERELVAKVKTGLSVLDTSAFLERLAANWTVLREEHAPTNGDRTSLQALRGAGADELSAGDANASAAHRPARAADPQTNQHVRRIVDLDALGRRFYRFFRSAPAPEFMTGLLGHSDDAQSTSCGGAQAPSESRSRPARETNLGTAAEQAEQVPLGDVQEQVRTDVEVKRMFDCMREHGPVELYDLVLDSTSFGRTVENIFHLSFLIRDGRVQLWRDGDRFMLKPLGRRGPEAGHPGLGNAGAAENSDQSLGAQTVLRFDWQNWTALCQQRGGHPPLLQRCIRESGGNEVV